MLVYWLEQTCADVPATNDWLGAGESAGLQRFRVPKRYADWRLGRWTAKRALAVCLDLPVLPHVLSQIEIRSVASGAPEVFRENKPAGVSISLSHRDGIAACAVTMPNAALGCDLEIVEPRCAAFVADYFVPEEQEMIARAPATERARLLALLWSSKESALKALREGLRLDTRSVVVSPGDVELCAAAGESARVEEPTWRSLCVSYRDGQVFHGWWQQTGELLRTMVADPAPASPILLSSCHPEYRDELWSVSMAAIA